MHVKFLVFLLFSLLAAAFGGRDQGWESLFRALDWASFCLPYWAAILPEVARELNLRYLRTSLCICFHTMELIRYCVHSVTDLCTWAPAGGSTLHARSCILTLQHCVLLARRRTSLTNKLRSNLTVITELTSHFGRTGRQIQQYTCTSCRCKLLTYGTCK